MNKEKEDKKFNELYQKLYERLEAKFEQNIKGMVSNVCFDIFGNYDKITGEYNEREYDLKGFDCGKSKTGEIMEHMKDFIFKFCRREIDGIIKCEIEKIKKQTQTESFLDEIIERINKKQLTNIMLQIKGREG